MRKSLFLIKKHFCVIDSNTLFPYCGKCNSDLYYSNINKALTILSKKRSSKEDICYNCWVKITELLDEWSIQIYNQQLF